MRSGEWHATLRSLSCVRGPETGDIDKDSRVKPLFDVGRVEITPSARAALQAAAVDPATLVARHQSGDWGDVDEVDRSHNAFGLRHGHRLASDYRLSTGALLCVDTAADRTATLVFL